ARGKSVLLLAPSAASIDRVLEMLGPREHVLALRCQAAEEDARFLPPHAKAFTLAERTRVFGEGVVKSARAAAAQAEQRARRYAQEQPPWDRFHDFLARRDRLVATDLDLRQQRERLLACLESEADKPETAPPAGDAWTQELTEPIQTRNSVLTRVDAALSELHIKTEKLHQERAAMQAEQTAIQPKVEAKQNGRFWSLAWWQATVQGGVLARAASLTGRLQQTDELLRSLSADAARPTAERDAATFIFGTTRARLIAAELGHRQAVIDAQQELLLAERAELDREFQAACQEVPGEDRPAALTHEAIAEAETTWHEESRRWQERTAFAHEWLTYLSNHAQDLPTRLLELVNVVAATTSSLPGNK